VVIVVHLASVWVPFTSEAKEAVAHYDELLEEMRRAVQECGRKLASHLRARANADRELKRRSLFERYIPEVAIAISEILGVEKDKVEKPFYKALPSFVRFADDGEGDGGSTPPPGPAGQAIEAPPENRKKGKAAKTGKSPAPGRGRGEQLSLVE
jgi:hypothetical protein